MNLNHNMATTNYPKLTNPSLDKIKEYMHFSAAIQKNMPDTELAQHFKDANFALNYIYLNEYDNLEKQKRDNRRSIMQRDTPKETTNDDILKAIEESRIRLTKQNAKLKEYIEEMSVKIDLLTQELQSLKSNI